MIGSRGALDGGDQRMAINLPHHLAEVINILGFNWPEIDEDQLKDAATQLRSYAQDCQSSHDTTHRIVTGDLPQVYAAQSYTALAPTVGAADPGAHEDPHRGLPWTGRGVGHRRERRRRP